METPARRFHACIADVSMLAFIIAADVATEPCQCAGCACPGHCTHDQKYVHPPTHTQLSPPRCTGAQSGQNLWLAAANGQHDEVAELLAGKLGQFYVDHVDTRDDMGWTSLRAAVNFGHLESARLLLEHGAHVDIADNRGDTPLMGALLANDDPEELVRLLLKHGANATRSNEAGSHALYTARHTGRCVTCAWLFQDAAERHSLREAAELQPALQSLLAHLELGANTTSRLLDDNILTVQALAEQEVTTLHQTMGIEPGKATEVLAAARREAEKGLASARKDVERVAFLRDRAETDLWDFLVKLHLIDELIDVILRERFYHLETLTDMIYSDQIKYGVSPQHVRALQAEVEAVHAPAMSRHPSPRGATGLDWRPHDDL